MNGACCAAATRPSGRSAWSIIPPPLTPPYEETGDYTDLHLIKRVCVRERGEDHGDASVSFNYYLNV